MKILVILGSPRNKGNSETLAGVIAETVGRELEAEIDYLRPAKAGISGCIGCGGCEKTGMCVIKDDMLEMYGPVDDADIILLTTPIYFYGPSAQLKAFIDRFQARWSRKYLLKNRFRQHDRRLGFLLSTAATKGKKLFDGPILTAKSFFDAIDVPYGGALTVRGVDQKGALAEVDEELERARTFALEIIQQYRA